MTYTFLCPKCHTAVEIEIKMADYDYVKNSQYCPKCGHKMSRKIEAPSYIDLNGNGYGVGPNGWNT